MRGWKNKGSQVKNRKESEGGSIKENSFAEERGGEKGEGDQHMSK